MTTPDVPLRLELTIPDLPGTPAQVWDAIATANGITSWFIPTDVDEREGGTIVAHMGEDASSEGTVTGWEPPRRFAYVEPQWAALTGHDNAAVTPMDTEFVVEAQSGGTSVVRVVSSAFGTGADWENEFFADMQRMWLPFFDRLRLYLTHFPGQQVTPMEVSADFSGVPGPVVAAMRQALGVDAAGQRFERGGLTGLVEAIDDVQLLVRLTAPVPGLLAYSAFGKGDGMSFGTIQGHFFSADAASFVERQRPALKEWLESLTVPAA